MILVAGRLPELDVEELVDAKRQFERVLTLVNTPASRRRPNIATMPDRMKYRMVLQYFLEGMTYEEIGRRGARDYANRGTGKRGREAVRCHINVGLRHLRRSFVARFGDDDLPRAP